MAYEAFPQMSATSSWLLLSMLFIYIESMCDSFHGIHIFLHTQGLAVVPHNYLGKEVSSVSSLTFFFIVLWGCLFYLTVHSFFLSSAF